MAVHFNHTILSARDSQASAAFLAEMLGLPAPTRWGPFQVVKTENGANLDYMDVEGEITPQHYAFLVSESEFDEIFGRIQERKLPYWADPGQTQRGEINSHKGRQAAKRPQGPTGRADTPPATRRAFPGRIAQSNRSQSRAANSQQCVPSLQ